MMQIGKNFLNARNKRGINQKDAAAIFEVTPGYLSKIETGKQRPSIDLIIEAAELYKVKPGYFFGDTGENEINLEDIVKENSKITVDGNVVSEMELKGLMSFLRAYRDLEKK